MTPHEKGGTDWKPFPNLALHGLYRDHQDTKLLKVSGLVSKTKHTDQ